MWLGFWIPNGFPCFPWWQMLQVGFSNFSMISMCSFGYFGYFGFIWPFSGSKISKSHKIHKSIGCISDTSVSSVSSVLFAFRSFGQSWRWLWSWPCWFFFVDSYQGSWWVWWLQMLPAGGFGQAKLHSGRPNPRRSQGQGSQIPWQQISRTCRTVPPWRRCQATQTFQRNQSHMGCYPNSGRWMGNLPMTRVCLWPVAWHSRPLTAQAMESLHGIVHRRSVQDSLIVGHVRYVDQ